MKYQAPKLRQMLAAQYALGTLRGGARRRFARLLAADPALRRELAFWEQRLLALHGQVAPQAPREVVWAAIHQDISRESRGGGVRALSARSSARGVNLWRAWAIAATISSAALGLGLWREMQRVPQVVTELKVVTVEVPQPMPYVAMLAPQQSTARWMIALKPEKGLMKVSATGDYAMDHALNCLELWVMDDAGKPHSLGVLPMAGDMDMPMPEMPMPSRPTLAVSMEPKGGSRTGRPTGPVILTAPVLRTS